MANLFFLPFRPAYDGNMKGVPGAKAWFTLEGTNTPSAPFTDEALTVAHQNPVIANGFGRFPVIWLDAAVSYRVRIYEADAEVGVDIPLEEYDPYDSSGILGSQVLPPIVDTRVELAALDTSIGGALLIEEGYEGIFIFVDEDLSTEVAADPEPFDYVAPEGTTGTGGAWVRMPYGSLTVNGVTLKGGRAAPIAGSKMKIDAAMDDPASPLEDQAAIWSGKVETHLGINKVFGASEGQAGSPSQALFVRAGNNGSPGDVVAITALSSAMADDSTVFGANLLAIGTGKDNCRFVGLEVDVEPTLADTAPAAGSAGIYINVFNKALNGPFIQTGGVGGGTFENGIILGGIASSGAGLALQSGGAADTLINATVGTFSTVAVLFGQGVSKGFRFARAGGGAYDDGTHLQYYLPTGGKLLIRDATGSTTLATFGPSGLEPNIQAVVSSATVTPAFLDDLVKITALATNVTLANWSGTAVAGHGLVIRIKDNGTARTIAYGSKYRAIGVTLPTTTVVSKTLYLVCVYNSDDDKIDVVSVRQEV